MTSILENNVEYTPVVSVDKNSRAVRGRDGSPVVLALIENLDLYSPARDIFLDWLYGQDGAYSAVLTKGAANNGLPGDISEINPDARSIIIIAESAATLDYDYSIQFSRNGVDDWYTVASATAVSVSPNQIDLPASLGYDQYVRAVITPDAGQSDTNAQMKVYLAGRGG